MDMETVVEKLSNHDSRIENLEEYQKKQNGTLSRLEDKLDKLKLWVMSGMLSIILLLLGAILS